MLINCLNCNTQKKVNKSEIKRGNGKFCSLRCSTIYNHKNKPKPTPNVKCAYCNVEFYKNKSKMKLSKSGIFFCCRNHKDLAQRIGGIKEIQPNHYGNSATNYRKKALNQLENKCNSCGYCKYIQVLEVHHIDGNRKNNDINNLEILCRNCHGERHTLCPSI